MARPLQRAPGDATSVGGDAKPKGYTLTNARFTPHARLKDIAGGGTPLCNRDPSAAVKAAQTALLDIGYSLLRYKNDGELRPRDRRGDRQFRADSGITGGEGLNAATMKRSTRTAPPPGQITEHYLDYARLFADGRLDVTLAIGYDEGKSHVQEDLNGSRVAGRARSSPRPPEARRRSPPAARERTPAPAAEQTTARASRSPRSWTGNAQRHLPGQGRHADHEGHHGVDHARAARHRRQGGLRERASTSPSSRCTRATPGAASGRTSTRTSRRTRTSSSA